MRTAIQIGVLDWGGHAEIVLLEQCGAAIVRIDHLLLEQSQSVTFISFHLADVEELAILDPRLRAVLLHAGSRV